MAGKSKAKARTYREASRTLTRAGRDLLRAVTHLLSEDHRARQKDYSRVQKFTSARLRAARHLQTSIRKQALSAAGIDTKAIANRQKLDQQAAKAFIAKQEKRARTTAVEVNKRHAASAKGRIARVIEHFGNPTPPGDDPTPRENKAAVVQILKLADSIQVNRPLKAQEEMSPGVLQNLARIYPHAAGGGLGGSESDFVNIDWHFVWEPPRSGPLDVISSLLLNGFGWARTDPIWLIGGFASYFVSARIGIYQGPLTVVDRIPQDRSDACIIVDVDLKDDGLDCVGTYNSTRFDDQLTLVYNKQLVVAADTPVDITIEVVLWPAALYGAANLNFVSPGYGLNVPFVEVYMP